MKPRPEFNEETAMELAYIVVSILGLDPNNKTYLGDIFNEMVRNKSRDGLDLAKIFELQGHTICVAMVSELEMVARLSKCMIDRDTRRWVIEEGVKLPLRVGDRVVLKRHSGIHGEIVGLNPDVAKYLVVFENFADGSPCNMDFEALIG